MIVVKLMGGLGNQMFQYAIGRSLAEKINTELKLDLSFLLDRTPRPHFTYRNYELAIFNIQESFSTTQEVDIFIDKAQEPLARLIQWMNKLIVDRKVVKERGFYFDPGVFNLTGHLYLEGYWQSEKYFKNIEKIIRQEFTFKCEPDLSNRQLLNKIESVEAVSVHIRRGDYVSDTITNQFHGVCGLEYYQQAIEKIAQEVHEPHFYIFSDNIDWAKKNIQLNFPTTYVTHNPPDKGYEDLRLMSHCKHHIIANSSFSWWAAWLNSNPEKIVIAPEKWFADITIDTTDLIPEGWIRI